MSDINFPSEEIIRSKVDLFCEKFEEDFLSKRKKYDSLLRKANKNVDSVDSSQPNTEQISAEYSSTMEEIYDMTLGRKQQSKARGIYRSLSRAGGNSVVTLIKSVARKIAGAFQYQLVMLAGPDDISKAASFCVHTILHHLKSPDAEVTEAALINAVLEEEVHTPLGEDLNVKTDFPDRKRLRGVFWTANGIFREPGIRWPEDMISCHTDQPDSTSTVQFSGSFTPFGSSCRPDIYGYRSPIHVTDSATGGLELLLRDRITLCRQKHGSTLSSKNRNVHQEYQPLQIPP